jgi:GDP-fucose transporter C1
MNAYKQIPAETKIDDSCTRLHYARVGSIIVSYMAVSISMVMINKFILKSFSSLPLTFLVGQLVVATCFLKMLFLISRKDEFHCMLDLVSLLPLIGMNVVGLSMNTLCLKYVDAMMYQVARSLVLPFTLAISLFLNRILQQHFQTQIVSVSRLSLLSCLIIFAGFSVGMSNLSLASMGSFGLIFSVVSSLTTSIHSIIIKLSMDCCKKFSSWELVYVNNLYSFLLLLPLAIVLELDSIRNLHGEMLRDFAVATFVSGLVGLLINYTSFLQIHVTSPLTHTVSSAARGVLQSFIANLVLKEKLTAERAVSIIVTLVGSTVYSFAKLFNI